ncbi:MFS transporter [Pelosinus sp. IPA-1]|uniref:MFS transporter n=1 Tax=Pelosinus sp. IPA-1 TaxID=3029569 RepID=UPI0024362295|nr:MFS transporter [Pelosinus sp. IPA-1]GMA99139.1 MFS transporter [Pelosinus sp. IPA-1]
MTINKKVFTPSPLMVLICGSIILALALGTRQSFGIFLKPMSLDLGYSRETFSFAIALQNLVWGIAQPFTGWIADRYGASKALLIGAVAYVLGLIFMANSSSGIGLTLSAGMLIGIGLGGSSFAVVFGALGRAFDPSKRSLVLGIAGAGASFGMFAMVPYSRFFINYWGWFESLIVLAITCALMFPLSLGLIERKDPLEEKRDTKAALTEAFNHRDFWLLGLGFSVCGFQVVFILTHFAAFIQDNSLSLAVAANALAIIGFSNMFGSYLAGYLGGKYPKSYLLSLIFFLRAIVITVFIAMPITEISVYVFSAAIGLIWLATVPLTNGILASVFGVKYLSTLSGIVFVMHQIGSFTGGWLGGLLFDCTGSYQTIWITTIILSIVAALCYLPIKERSINDLKAELQQKSVSS